MNIDIIFGMNFIISINVLTLKVIDSILDIPLDRGLRRVTLAISFGLGLL